MSWLTVVNPVPSPSTSLGVIDPSPAVLQEFGEFRYSQAIVNDFSRLRLFSNLVEPKSAAELAAAKNCEFLVNAGFYDISNQHLGWFQVNGRELSPKQNNRLFDGYLSITSGAAEIGFAPRPAADFGLQSGPVLVFDANPLKLTIKDAQPRRRMAAAITQDEQLIFLVILSPQSDYSGPLLADTPRIVLSINQDIVAAINLDGGSASAFITPEVNLPEYQPIGGYFCYTKL
ncbi:MAG: hypothetical protein UY17_C0024G0015 [Candidatus Beckwithbacteria bacterium GW2011_GWC2_47_9]|uniref:Phosphodiester glycosidase domain-containing protein n=1 Tax=Candidatus Beckwithbacteria bacterium GW2011_GWC2_47_9 TaxID=1618373 RepID=A0A0G1WYF0_9BACT|nr:MAG: hypothetical protein UY17_C0024G0015 [Candidatus Beckwithbacteria bacterium GW2011_GWC2_47_9]